MHNKKYIYTMYIYSICTIFAIYSVYPMGILWVCYGYPMVKILHVYCMDSVWTGK